MNKCLTILDL